MLSVIGFLFSIPAGAWRRLGGWLPFMRKSRARIEPDGFKVIPQSGNQWLELNFIYRGSRPKHPLVGRAKIFDAGGNVLTDQPLVEADTWMTSLEPLSNDRFRITVATAEDGRPGFFGVGPVSPKYKGWADPDLAVADGFYRVEISIGGADLKDARFVGGLLHSSRGFRFSGLRKSSDRVPPLDRVELAATILATFPDDPPDEYPIVPEWLATLPSADAKDLSLHLHQMGESQYGNVHFNLSDAHEPNITIAFRVVNSSVFSLVVHPPEGSVTVEHEAVAGGWNQVHALIPRGRTVWLKFRWVIDNEISLNTLKRLTTAGKTVYVSLDAVRVPIAAREAPEVKDQVRFPPQFWLPREVSVQNTENQPSVSQENSECEPA